MKNKILTAIIITLLVITSLHAQNSSISEEWEASPQYKEYLQFMELGDLKSAIKIKNEKIELIVFKVMKTYLKDNNTLHFLIFTLK